MRHFYYYNEELHSESIPVRQIAQQVGTPFYLYSQQALKTQWLAFNEAFKTYPHRICYAVKANSNIAVLNTLAELGSGFDIVSGGELSRLLAAGGNPKQVVFSGVGKTHEEIAFALQQQIFCFNVESEDELITINEIAKHYNLKASIAFRVNPDVDPKSHPYISTGLKESKFGIAAKEALKLYQFAKTLSHITIKGIACHIGSQLMSLSPFEDALMCLLDLVKQLQDKHIMLSHIDIGGGLGVRYQNEDPPSITDYANTILRLLSPLRLPIILQPGRIIAAQMGILVTKVLSLKKNIEKNFCIVDCAMNDFIRPALYGAWHDIIPVKLSQQLPARYDIVGPICENGDFLGKDRLLQVQKGDLLAITHVGAYGFVTSSNYNSRLRAAEVMIKNNAFKIIRHRETIQALLNQEQLC